MKKAVQFFDKHYLKNCAKLSTDQIIEFLENYRELIAQTAPEKCQLISLRIKPSLLKAVKYKATLEGIPYQSKIKQLMQDWVQS